MKITVTKMARDDLREIREHLSAFGETPPKRFRDSFERFISHVADMPRMFSRYEYNPAYHRAVLAYDYLVFYSVDEKHGLMKVYRVLHGKRNIVPMLE